MHDLSTMTNKLTHAARVLGALALLVLLAFPARAQESEEIDVNRIEVKDGKVYVNGEVVKELDNKDLPIRFSKDGDHGFAFFRGDGEGGFGNFAFRSPRLLKSLDNEPFAVWEGDDLRHEMNDFDFSMELEPLHESFEVMTDGTFGSFMIGSGSNGEIRKLERKSRELARKIRRSENGENAELNEELEALVNQIFDLKLEAQQERISKISADLEQLRQQVQERSASRDQIVQRRLSQLRGERDTLDW
ncbi:MAG: hypothetical protein BMS9Abin05_0160 [Rhodothermia bacterium]|nr:MAG: hypothetical protein BMS9Abin05_0160 [Rhodothermia bacterium]